MLREIQERFLLLGMEAVGGSSAAFTRFFQSELDKWSEVFRGDWFQAGIIRLHSTAMRAFFTTSAQRTMSAAMRS